MNSKDCLEKIRLAALSLQHNETSSGTCPECGHNKFYMTRVGAGVLYICHRASCNIKGMVPSRNTTRLSNAGEFIPKYMTQETSLLSEKDIRMFKSMYNITPPLTWARTDNRVVIPVKDADGIVWGTYAKLLPNVISDSPKVLLYPEIYFAPSLHFPKPIHGQRYSNSIILTEDPISAERLAQASLNSAALLGTSIKPAAIDYLVDRAVDNVLLALDFDALSRAVKIKQTYCGVFAKGMHVLFWSSRKDVKDMDNDEFNFVFGINR